jgi:hypothetical protein
MKFGMDYYINDKNTLSGYTNKMFFKSDGIIDISIINQNASQNILLNSNYLTDNDGTYNVALKHLTSKEGETLDLEVNHSIFTEDQIALFHQLYQSSIPSSVDSLEKEKNAIVNLDYTIRGKQI